MAYLAPPPPLTSLSLKMADLLVSVDEAEEADEFCVVNREDDEIEVTED